MGGQGLCQVDYRGLLLCQKKICIRAWCILGNGRTGAKVPPGVTKLGHVMCVGRPAKKTREIGLNSPRA